MASGIFNKIPIYTTFYLLKEDYEHVVGNESRTKVGPVQCDALPQGALGPSDPCCLNAHLF